MSSTANLKKNGPPVVHESETQRQHIRVKLPCTCSIEKKPYKVRDISMGGFGIETDKTFMHKKFVRAKIYFPLKDAAFHVTVQAEPVHYNPETQIAGFRFSDLSEQQAAVIRHMIQTYLAGMISTENDIITIISRSNNVEPPRVRAGNDNNRLGFLRYAYVFLIFLAGLAGLALIAGNVYENTSIVKSYMGVVEADTFTVRTSAHGTYHSMIAPDKTMVQKGEALGVMKVKSAAGGMNPASYSPDNYFQDVVLSSPCDCQITKTYPQEGEFRTIGEPVYDLLSSKTPVWISATVDVNQAYKLNIHDDARVKIAGEPDFLKGNITEFLPPKDNMGTMIKVAVEEEIPLELVGRPAYVEFILY